MICSDSGKELNTIYCNDKWNCPDPNNKMFDGCEKLKGAVAYNKNSTGGVMANPETGYFTRKTSDGIEAKPHRTLLLLRQYILLVDKSLTNYNVA